MCFKNIWLGNPGVRSLFIQVNEHLASHSAVVFYIVVLNALAPEFSFKF
jgi:hypothetical protein